MCPYVEWIIPFASTRSASHLFPRFYRNITFSKALPQQRIYFWFVTLVVYFHFFVANGHADTCWDAMPSSHRTATKRYVVFTFYI